ncbi:MAG: ABC transporter ATP-binding protein [Candidatus Rokubacteria bacterium]|nr:ABC transporter ATP-binding protein [Candidatus Rokubacteria bacterium]
MRVLGFIAELFRKFPLLLLANTFFLVVEGLLGIASLVTLAPIIDFFVAGEGGAGSPITARVTSALAALGLPATLVTLLAVFLAFQFLKNGFSIFAKHYVLRTKYAVLRELILGTFEDFFRARWLFFSSARQGTLLNTFIHEITVVGNAFGAVALFFASLLQLAFYLAVPFYVSWPVTAVSMTAALLFAVPFLLLGRVSYRLGRLNTSTGNEFSAIIQEGLSLAKVTLGFGNQHKTVADLGRAFDAHRRVTLKSQTLLVATPLMYEPLAMLVLVIAVISARAFAVPLSEMAVILWALRNSVPLLGVVATQRNSLATFFPSYEQLRELRRQARALRQTSGARPFDGLRDQIALENVSFAYPGQEPALSRVTVRIPKGRMVAFVGESGAGKSSLVDLIMGFHEPTSGTVTIDGVPLHEIDIDGYRHSIGYVPQESVLFNTTIRDNLRWAKDTATDAEIREACRRANAEEFIDRFPDGYDTVVGDRGVRLSGGQCQRMARAILRKPELLILDEATSSLDTHSERLIQQAIEAIARETTVVVIAHRLSTIVNADYVYVLQGGVVVEEGTYQALMRQAGYFSRMTQMQTLEAAGREA